MESTASPVTDAAAAAALPLFHLLASGACPKGRFAAARDGEQGRNYLCAGLHRFSRHARPAMQRMAQQYSNGCRRSEFMSLQRDEDHQRDADAACPCGSGAKSRFCHGASERRPAAAGRAA